MLIVALTGGIATGKSVVAEVLEDRGCYIDSADRAAHDLMKPGRPAWKKIISHFGPGILNLDQTINRSRLGEIVFSDDRKRHFLNELIHPLVLEKKKQKIRRLERKGIYRIFVSEAALTIEVGFESFFDKIIVVHCPEDTQITRLMRRDRISREAAEKRIRSQMSSRDKLKYADYEIDTSGSLEETKKQAEALYRRLICAYEKKNSRK